MKRKTLLQTLFGATLLALPAIAQHTFPVNQIVSNPRQRLTQAEGVTVVSADYRAMAQDASEAAVEDSMLVYLETHKLWDYEDFQGFHSYPVDPNGLTSQFGEPLGETAMWGVPVGDRYYVFTWDQQSEDPDAYYIRELDRATHEQLSKSRVGKAFVANDAAVDMATGRAYGVFRDPNGAYKRWWGYVDPVTRKVTQIAQWTLMWKDNTTIDDVQAICTSPDGTIYAVLFSGKVCTINKETGEPTIIGDTGTVFYSYVQGAAWDNKANRILVTATGFQQMPTLNAIDPATGTMTSLHQCNYVSTILYTPCTYIAAKAPAMIDRVDVNFEGGNTSGTVAFTAPTTCQDGSELSGELEYRVVRKGSVVKTGTVNAGEQASVTVSGNDGKDCYYSVYLVNAAGESLRTVGHAVAGLDNPAAPKVSVMESPEGFFLNWTPVSTGAQGGYIDADKVTYTIVRYPDKTTVASNIASTSFMDNTVAKPAQGVVNYYYYGVTATSGSRKSAEGTSKKMYLGEYYPSWTETFDRESALNRFTIYDVDNDERTWKYSSSACAGCFFHPVNPKNDWLISPPVMLKKGLKYQLEFKARVNLNGEEKFEVYCGNDNTIEAMTTRLLKPTKVEWLGSNSRWTTFTVDITPEEDGRVFIGWHAISDAHAEWLYIDNIEVKAGVTADMPASVTNLSATADSEGRLQAVVNFNMPSLNANGEALNANEALSAEILRDGTVVTTLTDLKPGQAVKYTDVVPAAGTYTYTVVPINANGRGIESSASDFIGNVQPNAATNVIAREDPNNLGTVTITWDAPALDQNGRGILPETLTYTIKAGWSDGTEETVATNVAGTSYTYHAYDPEATQKLVSYGVYAANAAGECSYARFGEATPLGKARQLPYNLSFTEFSIPLGNYVVEGSMQAGWGAYAEQASSEFQSQDGDGCFGGFRGTAAYDTGALSTVKFDLEGCEEPTLTFYMMRLADDDLNSLETMAGIYGEWESVDLTTADQLPELGWNKIELDLSHLVGETVQLRWVAQVINYAYVFIDNISFDEKSGVQNVNIDANDIVSCTFYDTLGREVTNPQHGVLYLVKTVYSDGSVKASKILIK